MRGDRGRLGDVGSRSTQLELRKMARRRARVDHARPTVSDRTPTLSSRRAARPSRCVADADERRVDQGHGPGVTVTSTVSIVFGLVTSTAPLSFWREPAEVRAQYPLGYPWAGTVINVGARTLGLERKFK